MQNEMVKPLAKAWICSVITVQSEFNTQQAPNVWTMCLYRTAQSLHGQNNSPNILTASEYSCILIVLVLYTGFFWPFSPSIGCWQPAGWFPIRQLWCWSGADQWGVSQRAAQDAQRGDRPVQRSASPTASLPTLLAQQQASLSHSPGDPLNRLIKGEMWCLQTNLGPQCLCVWVAWWTVCL